MDMQHTSFGFDTPKEHLPIYISANVKRSGTEIVIQL